MGLAGCDRASGATSPSSGSLTSVAMTFQRATIGAVASSLLLQPLDVYVLASHIRCNCPIPFRAGMLPAHRCRPCPHDQWLGLPLIRFLLYRAWLVLKLVAPHAIHPCTGTHQSLTHSSYTRSHARNPPTPTPPPPPPPSPSGITHLCRLKSRQQYIAAKTQSKPPGVWALAQATVRNEGPLALWNGLGPSVIRVSGGVGLYFSTLHFILEQTGKRATPKWPVDGGGAAATPAPPPSVSLAGSRSTTVMWAGATARAAAGIVMHPISVVKSRMETYRNHGYAGSLAALKTIARTEGVGGLYAGLGAALLRDVPYSAAYILFFKELLSLANRYGQHKDGKHGMPMYITFGAGLTAGLAATVVSHPFDVVKTRLQLDRLPTPTTGVMGRLLGVFGVLQHVLRTEGFAGAWRGLPLRIVRRPIQTAITWSVYGLFAGDQGLLGILSRQS
jgi:solute carrier family 25 protein 38